MSYLCQQNSEARVWLSKVRQPAFLSADAALLNENNTWVVLDKQGYLKKERKKNRPIFL